MLGLQLPKGGWQRIAGLQVKHPAGAPRTPHRSTGQRAPRQYSLCCVKRPGYQRAGRFVDRLDHQQTCLRRIVQGPYMEQYGNLLRVKPMPEEPTHVPVIARRIWHGKTGHFSQPQRQRTGQAMSAIQDQARFTQRNSPTRSVPVACQRIDQRAEIPLLGVDGLLERVSRLTTTGSQFDMPAIEGLRINRQRQIEGSLQVITRVQHLDRKIEAIYPPQAMRWHPAQ